jgi:hypothetical protein
MITRLILTTILIIIPIYSFSQPISKIQNFEERIGYKWEVRDSKDRKSTWTRRNESNIFDAVITTEDGKTYKAVYVVDFNGEKVRAETVFNSDGIVNYFEGIFEDDKNQISGTYTNRLTNEVSQWTAGIDYNKSYEYSIQGEWNCNDKGKYYIRQFNKEVYWYGEEKNEGPAFSNVAFGTISNDTLYLKYSDVPKGTAHGNGTLRLKIESSDHMVKILETGPGFGGSDWTKMRSVKN